ncbi:N-acetyltransferase family protein [Urechidicola vernalis]|uniref:GNAT family N-acetyltransferase n=1 Tax=Urechidicola vernalis TaxID=3075600 RepID=UPI003D775278
MSIRKAIKSDAGSILDLIQHLADFENEPDEVEVTKEDIERDGFGTTPLFNVFVAEVDNEVVGMAFYYYRYSTWKGKTIHLEDLIVREDMRKKNIGGLLYQSIMKQAFNENVRRVEWVVLDWNTPARNFYLNSGAKILEGWETVQMDKNGIVNFVEGLN